MTVEQVILRTSNLERGTPAFFRPLVPGLRMCLLAGLFCCLLSASLSAAAPLLQSDGSDLRGGANSSVQPPSLAVHLPAKAGPLPEPLGLDHPRPGFRFRGIKGWDWTPKQYLREIPYLAKFKMNFLMNCYLSMFTSKPGQPWKNEWWKPMSNARKRAYAKVIRTCRQYGITFCFAFHPQLGSPRPLDPDSQNDIDQFYRHYAWAQSQGVHWFSVSMDDVNWKVGGATACAAADARFVNVIFVRLRAKDPRAQLIFCPGPYWGDGTDPQARAYLQTLARNLASDVYIFWTGDAVVTPRITLKAAASYKSIVRHRLFLWDNYPVNDARQTLNLGPVRGREPGLCNVIDGYISNPMMSQDEINRLPMATCADYAYNPWAYQPARSIGEAILHLAETPAQRQTLKKLVEAYPGFLVSGGGTGTNPARMKLRSLVGNKTSHSSAERFLHHLQDIDVRLAKEFPSRYVAARKTVESDIAWMAQQLSKQQ